MTVTSTKYFTDWYLANGINRDWGFDFTILSQDDVIVQVRDGTDDTSIVEYTTDLAFYPTEDLSSGSVKFPVVASPLVVGKQVRLVRQVAYTQLERLGKEGKFLPKTHENAFDKVTIMAQQVERNLDRAIKVQIGGTSLEVVSSLADGEVLMKQGGFLVSGPTASSINFAQSNAEAAEAAKVAALAARDKAQEWAENAEDVPVETGPNRYSALHWAAKSADETVATAALKADVQALRDEVDTILATGRVPVGTIIYFASTTAPAGFLECDGAVVTALYPDLRALLIAAGSPFGVYGADPKLPDLRGEFMRGWDHGRGIDTGRVFGASQLDALQGHKHQYGTGGSANGTTLGSTDTIYSLPWENSSGPSQTGYMSIVTDGVNGTPRTAAETRPRNIAMLPCIKAFGAVNPTGMADLAALLTAIATQVQAEAGADNTKLMTPLRTRQAVAAYNKYEFISAHTLSSGGGGVTIQNLQDFETLILDGFFVFSVNAQIAYQVSANNGSSWISGATDYSSPYWGQAGGAAGTGSPTSTQGTLAPMTVLAGEEIEIWAKLARFNKAKRIQGFSLSSGVNSSSVGAGYAQNLLGSTGTIVALNAIRFFSSAGTMGYDFKLHGIRG